MRLDIYLATHHGLTRNKAQQLIAMDLILVNGKICNKASFHISDTAIVLIVADRRVEWVSRSAEKLAGFIERLTIASDISVIPAEAGIQSQKEIPDIAGSRDIYPSQYYGERRPGMIEARELIIAGTNCLDVGSSTGGFTQVLLQYGATHIDAVDVGTDQLHPSLRGDSRVSSYEQTDIRDFAKIKHEPYDIIVCDASFISLSLILDSMIQFASAHTMLIVLYKPQFEVGRTNLRKTGVPKDPKIVDEKMKEFEELLNFKNMRILKKERSSLVGEAGNQEWIYMIMKNPQMN